MTDQERIDAATLALVQVIREGFAPFNLAEHLKAEEVRWRQGGSAGKPLPANADVKTAPLPGGTS